MVNLSGALLMDGQHLFPQNFIAIAQEIGERYRNIRLVMIPVSERIPGQHDKPFGLKNIDTGDIIKTVPETMVPQLLNWLFENDSERHDTFQKHMDEIARDKAARQAILDEKHGERIDFMSSVMKSPLHLFKHDGKKISSAGIEDTNAS